MARSDWARGMLSVSTILLLSLAAWAVWNFNQALEQEAFEAGQMIVTSEGDVVQLDPELCEAGKDGSLEAQQRTAWIMFAVAWVAPLFVLYFFRKRFQPDDVVSRQGAHIAEAAGWVLVTVGGLFLVLTTIVAASNQLDSGEALVAAFWVGVPTVSGVLLVRWGRRRRAPSPYHTVSE